MKITGKQLYELSAKHEKRFQVIDWEDSRNGEQTRARFEAIAADLNEYFARHPLTDFHADLAPLREGLEKALTSITELSQTALEHACTRLVQFGYLDVTDEYPFKGGKDIKVFCAPNGDTIYCRTEQDVFEQLQEAELAAQDEYKTNPPLNEEVQDA